MQQDDEALSCAIALQTGLLAVGVGCVGGGVGYTGGRRAVVRWFFAHRIPTTKPRQPSAHINFFDARKPSGGALGQYADAHTDLVTKVNTEREGEGAGGRLLLARLPTHPFSHPRSSFLPPTPVPPCQVLFHPSQPAVLASGSEDGLVCLYDTGKARADEEALGTILNAECAVRDLAFFGSVCVHVVYAWLASCSGGSLIQSSNPPTKQRPGRRPGGADGLGGRQRVALALGEARRGHRQPPPGLCPRPWPRPRQRQRQGPSRRSGAFLLSQSRFLVLLFLPKPQRQTDRRVNSHYARPSCPS